MSLFQDTRFAARLLIKGRWFTVLAVATYAVGLGAAVAMYSIVDAVLVRPLPYRDADGIVQIIAHRMEDTPVRTPTMAQAHWVSLRDARTLTGVGAYDSFSNLTRRRLTLTITDTGGVSELLGTRISPALLATLGTAPAVGRVFDRNHEGAGRNQVILLADRAWRTHFNADAGVLGRSLTLDHRQYTVIGIMPPAFAFPDRQTDFWIPLTAAAVPPPTAPRTDSPNSAYADGVFARLAPGATLEAASAEVAMILRRGDLDRAATRKSTPEQLGFPASLPRRAEVVGMKDELVAPARPLLRTLSLAAACVLLIACANVAHLLLAGATARKRELAIRLALGATGRHLLRQALSESVLLALAGGLLAIPVAYWISRILVRLAPSALPRLDEVALDAPLLLRAAALAFVVGIGAGLVPAVRALRMRALPAVSTFGGRALRLPGVGRLGPRAVLVAVEIALGVVLLASAGLLVRSFAALGSVDHGYDPAGTLTLEMIPPTREGADARATYAEIVRRLEQLPGVEAAGATDVLPIAGASSLRLVLPGLPIAPGASDTMVMRLVTSGYFRAMGIGVLEGRSFSPGSAASREVIVNRTFARRYFGDTSPVGRLVGQGLDTSVVVGVVADVRHEGARREAQPEWYVDLRHSVFALSIRPFLVVRSREPATRLVAEIRGVVASVDGQAGVGTNVTPMAAIVAASVSGPRFNAGVAAALATVGMVLAALALYALALYGVLAHSVAQRARDLAVRVALGAGETDIIRLVLVECAAMAGSGLLAGLACALAVGRSLQSLLFGIAAFDPVTFAVTAAAAVAVSAAASWLPARRAARLDPIGALARR